MKLNKNDFIVILTHFKNNKEKDNAINFLVDLGIEHKLAKYAVESHWIKSSFGGSVYASLSTSRLLPDLSLKEVEVTYKVVKKGYEFLPPETKIEKGEDLFIGKTKY